MVRKQPNTVSPASDQSRPALLSNLYRIRRSVVLHQTALIGGWTTVAVLFPTEHL